jgi:hypothetical protein
MAGRKRVNVKGKAKAEPYEHIVGQIDTVIGKLTKVKGILASEGASRVEGAPKRGVEITGIEVDISSASAKEIAYRIKEKFSKGRVQDVVIGDRVESSTQGTGDSGYGIVSIKKERKSR